MRELSDSAAAQAVCFAVKQNASTASNAQTVAIRCIGERTFIFDFSDISSDLFAEFLRWRDVRSLQPQVISLNRVMYNDLK